jgi:hypothetical protein
MKTRYFLLLTLLGVLSVCAQTNSPEMNAPGENMQQPPPPKQDEHGPMAVLSPEEKARVKSAHDKAIQQDPSLEQKMKDARQAMESARKEMHAAMIKADPSVEPILAKMMPPRWGEKHDGKGVQGGKQGGEQVAKPSGQGGPGGDKGKGMANLTESERQQVMALREQVKQDPAVIAAHEAVKSAATPEAREQAHGKLRDAMHAAMIKADPSIAPILEKMHPGSAPQSSPTPITQ